MYSITPNCCLHKQKQVNKTKTPFWTMEMHNVRFKEVQGTRRTKSQFDQFFTGAIGCLNESVFTACLLKKGKKIFCRHE